MVANFAIHNSTGYTGSGRQQTLKKLAKEVIENANQKERDIKQVVDSQAEYVTAEYIPTETAISNLCAQAFLNGKLKESINFLNNKAAIQALNKSPKHIYNNDEEKFEVVIDESKNIFAA